VGELSDAIREHLELKRRRGADPAEVAREEHEALAPVTRSHPVVVAPPQPGRRADDHEFAAAGAADVGSDGAPRSAAPSSAAKTAADDGESDATQEFRVERDGLWLADDD
jgi:hypothetical protein